MSVACSLSDDLHHKKIYHLAVGGKTNLQIKLHFWTMTGIMQSYSRDELISVWLLFYFQHFTTCMVTPEEKRAHPLLAHLPSQLVSQSTTSSTTKGSEQENFHKETRKWSYSSGTPNLGAIVKCQPLCFYPMERSRCTQ